MRRPMPSSTEAVNGDSFLDIVASVVGIMIIMVVFEGARIKKAPVQLDLSSHPAAIALEKEMADEASLRADVLKTAESLEHLRRELAARGLQRDALATLAAAVEKEMQQHRDRLSGARQADFDLARRLSESQFELKQLEALQEQAALAPAAKPEIVENYPTPLSRAVEGEEAHVLLSGGRVVFVPVEPLLELFRTDAKRQAYKLRDQEELTDTVGPVEGFRLRYTLERYEIPPETVRETGQGGSFARLKRWTLVPGASDLGEPVRLALQEGSDFRRQLSRALPGRTVVTIWVYPDSFEAFRRIRKELYRQGYAIAARPLPAGAPIGGSPEGSKSAAQ